MEHDYQDCFAFDFNRKEIRNVITVYYLMCLNRVGLWGTLSKMIVTFIDLSFVDEVSKNLCDHVDDCASRLTKLLVPSLKDWDRCCNCHALVTPTFANNHSDGDVNRLNSNSYSSTMLCRNCICYCLLYPDDDYNSTCSVCYHDCCNSC